MKLSIKRFIILLDVLLLSTGLVFLARVYPLQTEIPFSFPFLSGSTPLFFTGLLFAVWMLLFNYFNLFQLKYLETIREFLKTVLHSTVFTLGLLILFSFLMHHAEAPRHFGLTLLASLALVIVIQKSVLLGLLGFVTRRMCMDKNILVIGANQRVKNFVEVIGRYKSLNCRILGFVDKDDRRVGESLMGIPIIGVLKDIPDILDRQAVHEVIFIVPRTWIPHIEESILECETRGIKTTFTTDLFNMKISKPAVSFYGQLPVVQYETTTNDSLQKVLKELVDVSVSFFLLLFLSPLIGLIALAIRLESKGPVFFRQMRTGLSGKPFLMFKFRSMSLNAEVEREKLLARNQMDGPVFKVKNDPRVTRIGALLRKTSLDELPQLINVFKGEMSLVGPRPLPVYEARECHPWQKRRTSVKPGMTCTWQVGGRNNIPFKEWMKMDLDYIDGWSILRDFAILIKTIPAVFRGHGAT